MSVDTDRIIQTHTLWAMGAGLIPLPLFDVAAVTAIQVDLLNSLCAAHGVAFTQQSGRSFVTALTGSTLARIAASMFKAIPGVGTIVGGLSMSMMAGASTWALGRVAAQQLERNGSLFDIDIEHAKANYDQAYEQGKEVVSNLKGKEDAAKDVFETLSKLGKLREQGVLTEEEFQAKKAELLAKIG